MLKWHFIWILALGYVLGYYFPQFAAMSVGKIKSA
jgi:hypothetical protein